MDDDVLIPLLQASSLASDEFMQERWAALLAHAANPSFSSVPPSFPTILAQMSPIDARILDAIYEVLRRLNLPPDQKTMHGAVAGSIPNALGIDPLALEIALENLIRLNLVAPPAAGFNFVDNKQHRYQIQNREIICGTALGWAFVEACKVAEGPA